MNAILQPALAATADRRLIGVLIEAIKNCKVV
jgi:hypothetical protein